MRIGKRGYRRARIIFVVIFAGVAIFAAVQGIWLLTGLCTIASLLNVYWVVRIRRALQSEEPGMS